MSVIKMKFESQYLGSRHPVTIILPDVPRVTEPKKFYEKGEKYKVLWLLHGTFGDCDDWLHRSRIEVYACEHNLAVVMPNALNTDYVNWKGFGIGLNMYDYFFKELMPMIYSWYPISDKREDNFIAGLSMGGKGAMVYALNHPEKFAAAASLSAPLCDPRKPLEITDKKIATPPHLQGFRPPRHENQISNMGSFEEYLASPANTWDKLAQNVANHVDMPKLYFCCGDRDFFYDRFKEFQEYAQRLNVPIEFEEEAGYAHEWRFWDKYIERIIDKFVPSESIDGLSF